MTQSQLNRLKKAHEAGKGVTIKMSKSQVAHNMEIQGGFLPLLASLASQALPFLTVLPALLVRYQGLPVPECKNSVYQEGWMCMRGRNGRTGIVLRTYDWQRCFEARRWTLSEE